MGAHDGEVKNCVFTDNTAGRSGGAIHWSGHNGAIRYSNFTNNIAAGNMVTEIGGKTGGGDGGAVLWVGKYGVIDNCRFISNEARKNPNYIESGRGGAIFLHGNDTENCTDANVTNSIFKNNKAGLNGGAIDWQEGAHEGDVENLKARVVTLETTVSEISDACYWIDGDAE